MPTGTSPAIAKSTQRIRAKTRPQSRRLVRRTAGSIVLELLELRESVAIRFYKEVSGWTDPDQEV